MFRGALLHGWWHRLAGKLTRRDSKLKDLEELLECCPPASSHYVGLRSIAIDQIQGTEGKADEFDRGFYPIRERTRSRWMEIAWQRLRGRDLPPVELIQVEDEYYVRDGHHRISVSRALGQTYVDAEITRMQLQGHNMMR
jgi:hypothetical protein